MKGELMLRTYSIALACSLVGLSGCATGVKQEISRDRAEIREHLGTIDREGMVARAHDVLFQSPHLNADQKQAMTEIMHQTRLRIRALDLEIFEAKLVLFNELLVTSDETRSGLRYETKIDRLTKDLKRLHGRKMDVMIEALADVRKALGDVAPEFRQRYHQYFLDGFRLTGS
jgi:hypothetical protein